MRFRSACVTCVSIRMYISIPIRGEGRRQKSPRIRVQRDPSLRRVPARFFLFLPGYIKIDGKNRSVASLLSARACVSAVI